jgi:hypothetical protein
VLFSTKTFCPHGNWSMPGSFVRTGSFLRICAIAGAAQIHKPTAAIAISLAGWNFIIAAAYAPVGGVSPRNSESANDRGNGLFACGLLSPELRLTQTGRLEKRT